MLELESISLNGKRLKRPAFVTDETGLTLKVPPKDPFTLEITTIVNPEANTALQGIYLSRGVYCSQCEAQGFRRITYFLDRPDVLARYTVRLEADVAAAPVLLANGNPVERGTLAAGNGTLPSGMIRTRSPLICSRSSAAIFRRSLQRSPPVRPQGRFEDLRRARQGERAPIGPWMR